MGNSHTVANAQQQRINYEERGLFGGAHCSVREASLSSAPGGGVMQVTRTGGPPYRRALRDSVGRWRDRARRETLDCGAGHDLQGRLAADRIRMRSAVGNPTVILHCSRLFATSAPYMVKDGGGGGAPTALTSGRIAWQRRMRRQLSSHDRAQSVCERTHSRTRAPCTNFRSSVASGFAPGFASGPLDSEVSASMRGIVCRCLRH